MSSFILYLKPFLMALILSLVFTKAIIKIGKKYKSMPQCSLYQGLRRESAQNPILPQSRGGDCSKAEIGKKKSNFLYKKSDFNIRKVTRFGGAAIIISFLLAIFLSGNLEMDNLKWGIVVSSLTILLFGIYDDLKNLSWKKQLIVQIAVALIMIYAGLNVDYIANPFGGSEFRLDQYEFSIFNFQFSILGSIFVLFWIIGFMNVTNWLDGLDGLGGGVSFIGFATLFFLSISGLVNQPPLGIICIALAGAVLGFLFFNFPPAKVFMGTSGSIFLGFMLAVAAIFSGGKIATALLVMGFPILDAVWVLAQRIKTGSSPFLGDTRHFHYRLLEKGWPQRKVVLFIYFICLSFGLSALIFQSFGKILALVLLLSLAISVVFILEAKKEN